jgi:glycerol-3-phosphate dehydrogenase (NAD(P)+)
LLPGCDSRTDSPPQTRLDATASCAVRRSITPTSRDATACSIYSNDGDSVRQAAMMQLRVAVMGGGSWGTTIASMMSRNTPTVLWARDAATVGEVNERHTNHRYLPDARLSARLTATADLGEAVRDADVIVMGVPSQTFRATAIDVARHIRPWVPVISLAKGLEAGTQARMTQIIAELLPGHPPGVLTGPNLAREIMAGDAAASVLAMDDDTIVRRLKELFRSGLFRVYTNTDVVGCELGGVLKNVVAIAAGMGDGLGAGDNTRAAVITRGLAEITRLGTALGGRPETFAGLAGMGDLVATCTSIHSRNRFVGEQLGKGLRLDEIVRKMHMVAEGVKSVPAVIALADAHGVEMPIAREVYRVVHEGGTPRQAFRGLIRRESGDESEPG